MFVETARQSTIGSSQVNYNVVYALISHGSASSGDCSIVGLPESNWTCPYAPSYRRYLHSSSAWSQCWYACEPYGEKGASPAQVCRVLSSFMHSIVYSFGARSTSWSWSWRRRESRPAWSTNKAFAELSLSRWEPSIRLPLYNLH